MKISDRDKKIIVIIFIALVVALPYLFIIKPTNEKITGVEGEIATLQARYDELKALEEQRGFYESEKKTFINITYSLRADGCQLRGPFWFTDEGGARCTNHRQYTKEGNHLFLVLR